MTYIVMEVLLKLHEDGILEDQDATVEDVAGAFLAELASMGFAVVEAEEVNHD